MRRSDRKLDAVAAVAMRCMQRRGHGSTASEVVEAVAIGVVSIGLSVSPLRVSTCSQITQETPAWRRGNGPGLYWNRWQEASFISFGVPQLIRIFLRWISKESTVYYGRILQASKGIVMTLEATECTCASTQTLISLLQ